MARQKPRDAQRVSSRSTSRRPSAPADPGLTPESSNEARTADVGVSSTIRLRLGPHDVRYGGRLVAGATAMEIFGDMATEIGIRTGGDEALSVGYDSVEFLAPLHSGDFVEGHARVVSVGRTSRKIEAVIYKVISASDDGVGMVHDPPVVVARASTTIVPMFRERGSTATQPSGSAAAARSRDGVEPSAQ
jgi:3-aminobutyryl-CoA ammonia-lyase